MAARNHKVIAMEPDELLHVLEGVVDRFNDGRSVLGAWAPALCGGRRYGCTRMALFDCYYEYGPETRPVHCYRPKCREHAEEFAARHDVPMPKVGPVPAVLHNSFPTVGQWSRAMDEWRQRTERELGIAREVDEDDEEGDELDS